MVIGRRFDAQATALAKQGRLAVYPSSRGQEACQAGVVYALRAQDWLFPTYRDCVAIVSRGADPVEALTPGLQVVMPGTPADAYGWPAGLTATPRQAIQLASLGRQAARVAAAPSSS
jgi:hypothetical protein